MELLIETLDDVLPHIQPDTGIIHSVHKDYSVVNYVFSLETTFDHAIARECRGLKFDPNGKIIARPFHKFFNLGEKRLPKDEPWDIPHVVLDKLDGSMIHPAIVADQIVFMTRMGVSAQSKQAWDVAGPEVKGLCQDMIAAGYTPVFEFTSPENRVVLAYDKPQLTLLAIRKMTTGAYLPHDEIARIAATHVVPLVTSFGTVEDVADFWSRARALQEVEGYVVAFDTGHRLKIKADAYVLRHKALAGLAFEKNLLAWVARDAVDDVLPLLAPEAADIVRAYQHQVMTSVRHLEVQIGQFVTENRELARKDFALKVKSDLDPRLHGIAFRALDGGPIQAGLMELLERASGSDTKVEAVRPLFGMEWQPIQSKE